jgi:hypothetical protein
MIASTSVEGTASRLTELLRIVHLTDNFLQRQVTNYSVHVFVPQGVKTSTPTLSQAVPEPGLAQSSMQAEISVLRSQNELLKSELQRLESENKEAEARNRRQRGRIRQHQRQLESSAGPSKNFYQPSASIRHFLSSGHPSRPTSSVVSTSAINPFGPDSRFNGSSSIRALPPIPLSGRGDKLDSVLHATRLQHEFDGEDRALSTRRTELVKATQRSFMCGICLEEMPEDSIARPDPCGHTFCRECLREHIATRLGEHRFPILCPTCTASKGKGTGAAGGTCRERMANSPIIVSYHVSLEVSEALALDLGLNDEQYSIWTEMEMAAFSILLHCRKYVHSVRPLLWQC